MNKELLRQVTLDQKNRKRAKRYIVRDQEDNLRKFAKTSDIVIISGIRRCGKSTLLDNIRAQNSDKDYYLNFDDERLIDFGVTDFQMLVEVFLELFGEQNTFYFDEIQNIASWERFVRRLHNEGKKVYITGSNASMLSRELGTHLTGRFVQLELYLFSFVEFLRFAEMDYNHKLHFDTATRIALMKLFGSYLQQGGLPGYLQEQNIEKLHSLYESIIYRDIVVRYNIPNEKPIKEMVYFCASNIGKEVSFHGLAKLIGLKNSTSVKEYLEYCQNSFLLFLVPRFSHSLKKQIYSPKKVYFIDLALAKNIGFRSSSDYERFLENMVFLQLKRQGKEIYYYQDRGECDFVVRQGGKIAQVIQVSKTLQDEKTKKREITGLLEVMKEFGLNEGLILTDDESDEIVIDGKKIVVMPVWRWLLER